MLNEHDIRIVITGTIKFCPLPWLENLVQVIFPYLERLFGQVHNFCGHSLAKLKSASVTLSSKHNFNLKIRHPVQNIKPNLKLDLALNTLFSQAWICSVWSYAMGEGGARAGGRSLSFTREPGRCCWCRPTSPPPSAPRHTAEVSYRQPRGLSTQRFALRRGGR